MTASFGETPAFSWNLFYGRSPKPQHKSTSKSPLVVSNMLKIAYAHQSRGIFLQWLRYYWQNTTGLIWSNGQWCVYSKYIGSFDYISLKSNLSCSLYNIFPFMPSSAAKNILNSSPCPVKSDFSNDSNKDQEYIPQSVKCLASCGDPEVRFRKEDLDELNVLEPLGGSCDSSSRDEWRWIKTTFKTNTIDF